MTINLADNDPRVSYSVAEGVTQTSFTVSFEFFDQEDLNVYVDGTLKTLTTDYTVTGGDGSTGSVSISVTGASGGSTVVVTRSIDLERTTDFPTSGAFNISALNTELDRFVAINADLKDQIDRSLKLSDYDDATSLTLPDLNSRKGKSLVFNSTTGDIEVGPSSTALNSIADYIPEINRIGDDLNAGSYVAGGEYDFGSITDTSVGTTGSPDGFIVSVFNNLSDITNVSGISSDVTTVSGLSTQVSTLSSNNANITAVGSNISNVNTVAGISSNVTTVAGISSDVTAVAADATDIGTVATNIASVNTVATNIADVITVANDLNEAVSEVVTVADDLNEAVSEIDTVANSISNVDAVGTNISNVNTVAGISANVTTVAGNSANVTTVAGISSDVTTVATNNANVTAVAGNATNINTVAGDTADINALGPISANITTVAGVAADVTTVAGISANTTTVAGIAANVTTVAGNSANVTTVAGISSDVTTVAGDSADIQTVATNLSSINDFADKYRIGATDPTTGLDEGDLFYNTTSDTLKVYNGTAWEAGVTAGSGFMSLSGGTFTGAVTFAAGQTFDGRDVSADGTKLDGIEANADVTDAANVEPLIDAHINVSGATSGQYLGWNGTDYAWSTVDLSTKLDLSGGTMTGAITFAAGQTFDGRDVSADGSKLDGIEAGADVTDATNVQAAGALMDSEISNLSAVKGINQALSTSSSPTFSTVTATNFNTTSDATLKTNVETLTGSLDTVKALRGVSYDWIDSGNSEVGVIAQEVEAVVPDVVSTNDQGIKSVKYGNLVGVLIEAIKEQQAQIDELKAKLGG